MPRRALLSLPGISWHIIQRGNNRSVCFHAEEDYYFYIYHLAELAARSGCAIHAYVLMTNGNHALGNARFQAAIEAALGRRAKRGAPGRPRQSATLSASTPRILRPCSERSTSYAGPTGIDGR